MHKLRVLFKRRMQLLKLFLLPRFNKLLKQQRNWQMLKLWNPRSRAMLMARTPFKLCGKLGHKSSTVRCKCTPRSRKISAGEKGWHFAKSSSKLFGNSAYVGKQKISTTWKLLTRLISTVRTLTSLKLQQTKFVQL
ncbi:hypothetical protein D3C81_743080 [compost metagenome]